MATQENIISLALLVNESISNQVKTLAIPPVELPKAIHPLTNDYVRKIEGAYSVSRSKADTDNAIDLLYIAYNTTPQNEGAIRVSIANIMTNMINAQGESKRVMDKAVRTASQINKNLETVFKRWEQKVAANINQEIKSFIGKNLVSMAENIKNKAEAVSNELGKVAERYTEIIEIASKTTNQSELALSRELSEKAKVELEMTKSEAESTRLETLTKDLEASIVTYQAQADEFKAQAKSAEDRAFAMSIVGAFTGMIAAVGPAIVAGVGSAVAGGQSLGTAPKASRPTPNPGETEAKRKEISDKESEKKQLGTNKLALEEEAETLEKTKSELGNAEDSEDTSSQLEAIVNKIAANEKKIDDAETNISNLTIAITQLKSVMNNVGKSDAEKEISINNDISTNTAEKTGLETEKANLEKNAENLKKQKDSIEENPEKSASGEVQLEQLEQDIRNNEKKLADNQRKLETATAVINGLSTSLLSVQQSMTEMATAQTSKGNDLRALQMEMTRNIEAYEKEKRTHNAELAKIGVLLKGQKTQEITIQLAIQSLEMSISALKRMYEIVVEIQSFFLAFADYMRGIMEEAENQSEEFSYYIGDDDESQDALNDLLLNVRSFFISQTGQWFAVQVVSAKFSDNFKDGQSKLNKLAATYLTGDALKSYLAEAQVKIDNIVNQRNSDSLAKEKALVEYRAKLELEMGPKEIEAIE